MSDEPIMLFLHGVGSGDPEDAWHVALSGALVRLGYPTLDSARVIAPKYAHALVGFDEKERVPPITVKLPPRDTARELRRDFERRTSAIEFRLGRHDEGSGWIGGESVVDIAFGASPFVQAHNYLHNDQIRAQVLNRVLGKLPASGKLLIVGHSLGSVIAADLIRRLPEQIAIVGMVTIGSPLANGGVDVDDLRDAMKEPPTNLGWWVNFWNQFDPVAAHRGLSSVFPWMLDLRVVTPPTPRVHNAVEYLADTRVATAIGFGLFGSLSQELATASSSIDIPLDEAEQLTLLALRYAHLTAERLDGDVKARFEGALRQVQATVVSGLIQRRRSASSAIPSFVARLAFNLADPEALVPAPLPSAHLHKESAIASFIALWSENVLRPFEITVPDKIRRKALEDLAAESGVTSAFGSDVVDAAGKAEDALSKRNVNWVKLTALGAGAAALIVVSGGIAAAAGTTLVGAAAVTSGLAAFGPGGMIGGLITAGSLVTAGGTGITYGLVGTGTSAETVESVITRLLTSAILRQQQGLEQDPSVWRTLVDTEREIRREHERLDEFSDPAAASIKELQRKIRAIERAIEYLTEHHLEPVISEREGATRQ